MQRQFTGHDPSQAYEFRVPIQSHHSTMYSVIGYVFEYIVAAFAIFFIILAYFIEYLVSVRKTWTGCFTLSNWESFCWFIGHDVISFSHTNTINHQNQNVIEYKVVNDLNTTIYQSVLNSDMTSSINNPLSSA